VKRFFLVKEAAFTSGKDVFPDVKDLFTLAE